MECKGAVPPRSAAQTVGRRVSIQAQLGNYVPSPLAAQGTRRSVGTPTQGTLAGQSSIVRFSGRETAAVHRNRDCAQDRRWAPSVGRKTPCCYRNSYTRQPTDRSYHPASFVNAA